MARDMISVDRDLALPPLNLVQPQKINTAYRIADKDGKPDSNFIILFGQVIDNLTNSINAVIVAFNTAQAAQTSADQAQTTADNAQDGVDQLAADQYVIAAPSPDLVNARVLTDTAFVTKDIATAGQIKILVDALGILNLATVILTQSISTTGSLDVTGPTTLDGGVKVTGLTETDSLRINGTNVAGIVAQAGSVLINVSGANVRFLTG